MEFADFVVYQETKLKTMEQVQFLLEALIEVRNNEWKVNSIESCSPVYHQLEYEVGRKYIKVWSYLIVGNEEKPQRSCWMFVDKVTGECYKPASYKAPAKGVRFNLLVEEQYNWLQDHADPYGSFLYAR